MTDPTLDAVRASVRSNVPADTERRRIADQLTGETCVASVAVAACNFNDAKWCRTHGVSRAPGAASCYRSADETRRTLRAAAEVIRRG